MNPNLLAVSYLQVKTGNFAEHSNQLWSISSVDTWNKINSGLVKMFQKEVFNNNLLTWMSEFFECISCLSLFQLLAKFPVIQHVMFGSILEFKKITPGTILSTARLGMLPPRRTTLTAVAPKLSS